MLDLQKIIEADKPFLVSLKDGVVTIATGRIEHQSYLAHVNRTPTAETESGARYASFSMIPFAQIKERGFEVVDDGCKIISLIPDYVTEISKDEFFKSNHFDAEIKVLGELQYNYNDEEYAQIVAEVIEKEIKNGEGSNFLISRKFKGQVESINPEKLLSIFTHLCNSEISPYMIFCFYDGEKYFACASPERHLSIKDDIARMSPISGTMPKKAETLPENLLEFVQDEKEINELFMVVDETLKMMMPLCPAGGDVEGPHLREMRTLIHTENQLVGRTDWDVVQAFRATMYAPTMIGSPLESACRVIRKHERGEGRRYYSSALMILSEDKNAKPELDSAITIRMVEIQKDGSFTVQAGGSIVRDSVPEKEGIESRVKANSMLQAIANTFDGKPILQEAYNSEIESKMMARNDRLSPFWINNQSLSGSPKTLQGKSIFIINNEDDFVHMTAHLLRHMGASVKIESINNMGRNAEAAKNFDMVMVGPGPGDPNNGNDTKMNHIKGIVQSLRESKEGQKFFGICLGHQVISYVLGLSVEKLPFPLQGVQKPIDVFGKEFRLGFYNTFCPRVQLGFSSDEFEVAADKDGFVFATRGANFGTIQGHPESILAKDGYELLQREISRLLV